MGDLPVIGEILGMVSKLKTNHSFLDVSGKVNKTCWVDKKKYNSILD